MKSKRFRVVAIGTSAGGLNALCQLLGLLPSDFPAAVFVVQHMDADVSGDVLVRTLAKHCPLRCGLAVSGERIAPGRVYIAPPDHHLLVSKKKCHRVERRA